MREALASVHAGSSDACLPRVLIPFSREEGLSVEEAASLAGKSVRTMRLWCELHDIGRRVGGGAWVVSRVALAMFLDDDQKALSAYLAGDRFSPLVVEYFERAELGHLIRRWNCDTPSARSDFG